MTGFNFRKHLLKAGTVGKIHTTVPVIYELSRIGESVIVGILFQDSFLVYDAVAFAL